MLRKHGGQTLLGLSTGRKLTQIVFIFASFWVVLANLESLRNEIRAPLGCRASEGYVLQGFSQWLVEVVTDLRSRFFDFIVFVSSCALCCHPKKGENRSPQPSSENMGHGLGKRFSDARSSRCILGSALFRCLPFVFLFFGPSVFPRPDCIQHR